MNVLPMTRGIAAVLLSAVMFIAPAYSTGAVAGSSQGESGESSNESARVDGGTDAESALSPEANENPLDGRRLFFTQAQRLAASAGVSSIGDAKGTASQEVDAGAVEADGVGVATTAGVPAKEDPGSTRQPVNPNGVAVAGSTWLDSDGVSRTRVMKGFSVYFDGVVSGSRGIQLLVNGLPCLPLHASPVQERNETARVNCPAVAMSNPHLELMLSAGRLKVFRKKSVVAVLEPGQGL